MKELIIKKIPIYNGKIVKLNRNLVKLPNGNLAFREVVDHRPGICILPIINDEILFVKQFRAGTNQISIELPAGIVDENEEMIDAAMRELAEETGYSSTNITYLGNYYASPGFTNELVHLYLAEDLFPKQLNPDEDEFIELIHLPLAEVLSLIETNQITDMKTVLLISLYLNLKNIPNS